MKDRFVFLSCPKCIEWKVENAASDEAPLTMNAIMGGVVQEGILFNFAKLQHDTYGHNRFDVYDREGAKVGEAGMGRKTGFVVWLKR